MPLMTIVLNVTINNNAQSVLTTSILSIIIIDAVYVLFSIKDVSSALKPMFVPNANLILTF